MKEIDNIKLEKAQRLGQTVQPYLIFIGEGCENKDNVNVTDYYVVINNNFLKLESPLKALEVCFKSFFCMHLNYPAESDQIWQFVQKYFFNINTNYDKNYQMVNIFINDLNKF